MCGNGARAAAFYAYRAGLAPQQPQFVIGEDRLRANVKDRQVALTLQMPQQVDLAPGALQHSDFEEVGFAITGVPHYVLLAPEVDAVPVVELGRFYRHADAFAPRGTNVNFVQRIDERRFKIRTYERGVETETLACGTGVVSSAYLLRARLELDFPLTFETRGGRLAVDEDAQTGQPVLSGEVRMLYRGDILTEFFETW
ncbi:MAG: diaminopimelate epimerase [candidate division KSB1 bacterium]|nr:diaminopimelate epimerase [candidate division KSB1 bacterium]